MPISPFFFFPLGWFSRGEVAVEWFEWTTLKSRESLPPLPTHVTPF
jgi:hypothetical protein